MTFLSKFGILAIKGLGIVSGITDLLNNRNEKDHKRPQFFSDDIIGKLLNTIGQVETVGLVLGLRGPDKLKAAVSLITSIILTFVKKDDIRNKNLFQSGVTKITDGLVEILNSLKENVADD